MGKTPKGLGRKAGLSPAAAAGKGQDGRKRGRVKKEQPVLSDLLLSLAAPAATGIPFSLPFDCIAQLIRHIKDPHDFIAALAEEGIGNFRLS